jgi:hypothetical protein
MSSCKEATTMCSIYSNSIVNIAAASARNGDEGFLFDILSPIKVSKALVLPLSKEDVWIWPSAYSGIGFDDGYLADRTWCYQERILAPRTLTFERHELFFRCREYLQFDSCPLTEDLAQSELKFSIRFGNGETNTSGEVK